MMLEELRASVCAANRQLMETGLVILNWGNVSAFDQDTGLMVIKPSGLAYERLEPEDMVLVDLEGKVAEGKWKPSSDTATHLELYRSFPEIRSIAHTHSNWATIWAQMGENIPALGTTHADDFGDEILCTRALTEAEIRGEYEKNTGKVIVEALRERDMRKHFAILVQRHGPFVWDDSPQKAVEKALVLENVAMMAWHCRMAKPELAPMSELLLRKHFDRKHGENAYYGQK